MTGRTAQAEPVDRRERQRAATAAEIKQAARRQLAADGVDGISLRGIAREIGMTAPGLYRYFASLEDLLEAMCQDFFAEVNDVITRALTDAADRPTGERMSQALRAFRRWAVAHPAELGLMFRAGSGAEARGEQSQRFTGIFFGLFATMWEEQPFDLPDLATVPETACAKLEVYARQHGIDLPRAALWVFASSWVRLYGAVCMEAFGQLDFMFTDVEPYFEAELASIMGSVGLEYVPPAG